MKVIGDHMLHMFSKKRQREMKTIQEMIMIYCHGRHKTAAGLCPECEGLLSYATQRIHNCPLKEKKTTCAKCQVHCYKPEMREKIRDVMRYAGPRMTYKHPFLTIHHLLDGWKPVFIKHITKKRKIGMD
jgi:hypothetical protein